MGKKAILDVEEALFYSNSIPVECLLPGLKEMTSGRKKPVVEVKVKQHSPSQKQYFASVSAESKGAISFAGSIVSPRGFYTKWRSNANEGRTQGRHKNFR